MQKKFDDNYFKDVEKRTNVKKEDILKLAQSIQHENLRDDEVLRNLIQNVSKLAGKEINKTQEEKILNSVKKEKL